MADILKISDATALALHTMVYLAQGPADQATTAEIAEAFKVSKHHLAKVHQRLSKSGLVRSHRGPSGGVALGKPPEKITLLEVYEVMEGPMQCHPCLFGDETCRRGNCILGTFLPGLATQMRDYFENTTLATLAKQSLEKNGK
ncbi:MAG: Rrf2 family transcriptional regulator [Kiritimatiellales bacterium]|nr:Rrf2 family transcriptional regulator [Kiritimatiellales bacterium]